MIKTLSSDLLWIITKSLQRPSHRLLRRYVLMARHPPWEQASSLRFLDSTNLDLDTKFDRTPPDKRLLCNNSQHSREINIHAPSGIRTRNPSKREAAVLRLRPRGHSDRSDISLRANKATIYDGLPSPFSLSFSKSPQRRASSLQIYTINLNF